MKQPHRTSIALWILGALAGTSALTSAGCSLDTAVARAGLPGTTLAAEISNVKERGSYIDARVVAGGFDFRLFFPADDTCRGVLASSEGRRFTWLGLMGRVTNGDERCNAVGVLSLVAWRDRQPRRSREPLPRAPVRYQVVYRDDELVQLHGRFPLASHLGFTGTQRLVAVIPNDKETCSGFADRGTASMEFRVRGPNVLTLIDGNSLCVVQGMAQPPPQVLRPQEPDAARP
jgi:hypothetical protein